MKEGEVEGENEEGADGSVFFAAKWQRARANRVRKNICRYVSQEYKRTTDSQATGHLLTTNQSVSFFFPMPFSPTTYFTTRPTSPSAGFSFLLLVSLILRPSTVLLLPGLPSSARAVSFQFSQMLHRSSRYRGKEEETVGGTVATLILHFGKGGWRTVGERWSLGGLA